MKKVLKAFASAALVLSLLFGISGCQRQEGPAERAGEQNDEAVEEGGEQLQEAEEEAREKTQGEGE